MISGRSDMGITISCTQQKLCCCAQGGLVKAWHCFRNSELPVATNKCSILFCVQLMNYTDHHKCIITSKAQKHFFEIKG